MKTYNVIAALRATPAYVFDVGEFEKRVRTIHKALPGIPLTYSIKANPFLASCIPSEIAHLEVCSPGELSICETLADAQKISLKNVIYSGVNKTREDVQQALGDGVGILTAESLKHLKLINEEAADYILERRAKAKVILRLSSGNQFGIDVDELKNIVKKRNEFKNIDIYGLHFYSGTQKKKPKQIRNELEMLDALIEELKAQYEFDCRLVEYGPGLAVDYFSENAKAEENDMQLLNDVAPVLNEFAQKHFLGVEMGRFMSATCGHYFTKVSDVKTTQGVNYAILDGGIHHLKYHGQTLAMQAPPISVYPNAKAENEPWYLCGSLCTTADVLVRNIALAGIKEGVLLEFGRCGAYSVTEAPGLFLSREMPGIFLYDPSSATIKNVRRLRPTWPLNFANIS